MKLSDYLKNQPRGALLALAKKIGAHAPDLSRWASDERSVPIIHCAAIEKATDGQVSRQDLRPNDWAQIWPELTKRRKSA